MTMICVPIMVEEANTALLDASLAQAKGAELVEYRVDLLFEQRDEESLEERTSRVLDLVEESPLPCIVTCRPHWEGGEYHGDDDERISLYIALGTSDHPPAYIDVELATYTRSANIKEKINLAVGYKKLNKLFGRRTSTRLILSSHDFEGRPADLTRRIIAMNNEPACSVVKIAYRARSIRDNLELFEILRDRQKPTIALGMGEFGTMSRILAPKFGGLLTFASLRSESTTAPGQPTIDELLNLYRFRSIKSSTKVYGIIGWPITQSMSPLVHNAGFEKIGFDAVYVPMPVERSYESFKATFRLIADDCLLDFSGSSVTIPHKEHALESTENIGNWNPFDIGATNTLTRNHYDPDDPNKSLWQCANTDAESISRVIDETIGELRDAKVAIFGSGGAGKAAAYVAATRSATVSIFNRSELKAQALADSLNKLNLNGNVSFSADLTLSYDLYINCTPVGMTGGSDPDGLSIPIPDMPPLPPETVFFDTVYNPIETPMLKAAKERGYRTIDGVQMFVKQAEAQFELWTGQSAPEGLFDRLVREKLSENSSE